MRSGNRYGRHGKDGEVSQHPSKSALDGETEVKDTLYFNREHMKRRSQPVRPMVRFSGQDGTDDGCLIAQDVNTDKVDIQQEFSLRQSSSNHRPVLTHLESSQPQQSSQASVPTKNSNSKSKNEPNGMSWFEMGSRFSDRPGTVLFSLEKHEVIKEKWMELQQLLALHEKLDQCDENGELPSELSLNGEMVSQQTIVSMIERYEEYEDLQLVQLEPHQREGSLRLKIPSSAVEFNCVKNAFKRAGFKRIYSGRQWNALWGKRLNFTEFSKLEEFQKCNHFPGTFQLGRKDSLARNLARMKRLHGFAHFDFFPDSYLLPHDRDMLSNEFEHFRDQHTNHYSNNNNNNNNNNNKKKKKKGQLLFIVKPKASSCGRGIKIINSMSQVSRRPCLVQRYLDNPLLIQGKKFDLRLYVVVTSFDPLRIYMHRDGLVRFATYAYKSDRNSLKNRFMHLTNYSINKKSKHFEKNVDASLDRTGSKWNIQALREYLRQQDIDDGAIWKKIADIVVKTFISVDGKMNSLTKTHVSSKGAASCYELFGFDVMIDCDLKPWLLEVNTSPSLSSSGPLDKTIKNRVVTELFNLVGFSSCNRKQYRDKLEEERHLRLIGLSSRKNSLKLRRTLPELNMLGGLHDLTPEDVQIIQDMEDEYHRRGHYERIFPTLENALKYAPFFECQRYRNTVLTMWLKEKAKFQRNASRLERHSSSQIQLLSTPPSSIHTILNSNYAAGDIVTENPGKWSDSTVGQQRLWNVLPKVEKPRAQSSLQSYSHSLTLNPKEDAEQTSSLKLLRPRRRCRSIASTRQYDSHFQDIHPVKPFPVSPTRPHTVPQQKHRAASPIVGVISQKDQTPHRSSLRNRCNSFDHRPPRTMSTSAQHRENMDGHARHRITSTSYDLWRQIYELNIQK